MAISGSLQAASRDTALLRLASSLAPECMEITLYDGIGDLPLFNPDLDTAALSSLVEFRARLDESDGVLIASPEHAHGVPGVLKNALDWIIETKEIANKPIAILNASPRTMLAQKNLTEILTAMDGRIVPEASIIVPLASDNLNETKNHFEP
ncbi:NADPH-dependent FMN reductase [Undibacterium arcticum]